MSQHLLVNPEKPVMRHDSTGDTEWTNTSLIENRWAKPDLLQNLIGINFWFENKQLLLPRTLDDVFRSEIDRKRP